ncbi:MAG: universal stress protein [Ginsengibacter sp.]
MKTIIASTDFSATAENACLYAAKLAAYVNAELILFHTIELPVTISEYPVVDEFFDEEKIQKELESLRNQLLIATNNSINIQTNHVIGSVEFQIKELCEKTKPFAVVMGTHSSHSSHPLFPVSTSFYSAKHLHYPVILVPPEASYKSIKKIALASDLKDIYEIPVVELEIIIKAFYAKFEIFYVGKDDNEIDGNAVSAQLLDNWLEDLYPTSYYVKNDDVWRGIAELTKEHNLDLVIIIPKKHGFFHKSQAKDILLHLDVPVMAVHEND